jgi:hypothetical protein
LSSYYQFFYYKGRFRKAVNRVGNKNKKPNIMSNQPVMSEQLVGAYTPYTCEVSSAAKKAFEQAMEGFVGVKYTPVAVSSQVVSGTNYKFFCNAEKATAMPVNGAAIVSIYAPLEGPAHITHIQSL